MFLAVLGLHGCGEQGLLKLRRAGVTLWLWCAGFSCCRALALGVQATAAAAHGLSCPQRWNLP